MTIHELTFPTPLEVNGVGSFSKYKLKLTGDGIGIWLDASNKVVYRINLSSGDRVTDVSLASSPREYRMAWKALKNYTYTSAIDEEKNEIIPKWEKKSEMMNISKEPVQPPKSPKTANKNESRRPISGGHKNQTKDF